jgi:ferredoxin
MPAIVDKDKCTACGTCVDECAVSAITMGDCAVITADECVECGACVNACPAEAITLPD